MSSFRPYHSALEVLQAVSGKYGVDRFTSYVGNKDSTAVQFLTILNEVGEELIEVYEWEMLCKTLSITTVIGQVEYDLPEDFDRFRDVTGWNTSTSAPLIGSIAAPTWKRLKASSVSGVLYLLYQIKNDKLLLFTTPTTQESLTFEYVCRGWVAVDDGTFSDRKDQVTTDEDLILYPKKLIKSLVALRWCQIKGFDTTAVGAEASALLSAATAKDIPAERLSIVRSRRSALLDVRNIPETGLGS